MVKVGTRRKRFRRERYEEKERCLAEKERKETREQEEQWLEREGERDGYSAAWRVVLAVGRRVTGRWGGGSGGSGWPKVRVFVGASG